MTNSSDSAIAFSLPSGEVPLGIQSPLLPSTPLGQSMLQPKFLTPLGARSLAVLDSSIFSSEALTQFDPQLPFQDSPFFDPPEFSKLPVGSSQTIQPTLQPRSPEVSRDSIRLEPASPPPELISDSVPTLAPESIADAIFEPVSELTPRSSSELTPESTPEVPTSAESPIVEANISPVNIDRSTPAIALPAPATSPDLPSTSSTSVVQPSLETAIAPAATFTEPLDNSVAKSSETIVEPLIENVTETQQVSTEPVIQTYSQNTSSPSLGIENSLLESDLTSQLESTAETLIDPLPEVVVPQHKVSMKSEFVEPKTAEPKRERLAQSTESIINRSTDKASIQSIASATESVPDLSRDPLDPSSRLLSSPELQETAASIVEPAPQLTSEEPIQLLLTETSQSPEIQTETPSDGSSIAIPSEQEEPIKAIAVQPFSDQELPSEMLHARVNDPARDLPSLPQNYDRPNHSDVTPMEARPERPVSEIQTSGTEAQIANVNQSEAQHHPESDNDLKNQTEIISEVEPDSWNLSGANDEIAPSKELTTEHFSQALTHGSIQDGQSNQAEVDPRSTIQPENENQSPMADVPVQLKSTQQAIQPKLQEAGHQAIAADSPLQRAQVDSPVQPDHGAEYPKPIPQSENQRDLEIQTTIQDAPIQLDQVEDTNPTKAQTAIDNQLMPTAIHTQSTHAEEDSQSTQPESNLELKNQPTTNDDSHQSHELIEQTPAGFPSPEVGHIFNELQLDAIENSVQPTAHFEPENQSIATSALLQSDQPEKTTHQQDSTEILPTIISSETVGSELQAIQSPIQAKSENQTTISNTPAKLGQIEASIQPDHQWHEPIGQSLVGASSQETENEPKQLQPDIQLENQSGIQSRDQLEMQSETTGDLTESNASLAGTTAIAPIDTPLEKPFNRATETKPMSPAEILPTLPTAIQRLSIWEPLVQLQPISSAIAPVADQAETQYRDRGSDQLLARKARSTEVVSSAPTAPSPNRLSDSEPVTEWSSIAELLQASTESRSERQPDIASGITSEMIQADGYTDLNLYSESNSTPVDSIQRDVEAPTTPALPAPPAPHVETTNPDQPPASQQAQLQASPEQLEQLAQEVYRAVRQRLALERERFGNLYSGRLL